MALITRVSRLLTADLHAVLDRMEEPDVLLKHAIREMEQDLDRRASALTGLRQQQAELVTRGGTIESSRGEVQQQLQVCLDAGEDDLARAMIRRRLQAERLINALNARATKLAATIDQSGTAIEEDRARLARMRQKVEALIENPRPSESRAPGEGWECADFGVGDDEVEAALLCEKQRRCAP